MLPVWSAITGGFKVTTMRSRIFTDRFIAYANHYHANQIQFLQRIIDPTDLENTPYYSAWLTHQKRNPAPLAMVDSSW